MESSAILSLVLGVPSSPVVCVFQISGYLFLQLIVILVAVVLLCSKSYKLPKRPLTLKEVDELCEEWRPEPLLCPITEDMQFKPPLLESAAGPHTTINGKKVVNFASANYLGLIGNEKLLETCTSALEKYGVGSCGPRAFYGTVDVHLDCEARIAKFLGTTDSILYSYGLSTMFSTIPNCSKKGDIVVADEGVHWGIQNGLCLSRSKIVYFKHNNMESLRNALEKITAQRRGFKRSRRYIVVEAIYQNSGQLAPLDEIVRLKEEFRFRLLLDETNSFGVLGSTGRGLTEQFGVPVKKIDVITAGMGHALATEGGFCTGDARVIDHQRLSSSGYVYSASLPPYLASTAITAINVLEDQPQLLTQLKKNVTLLWKGLANLMGLSIVSDPESPIVFLRLTETTGSPKGDLRILQEIADRVLSEDSVFVVTSKRSTVDKCPLAVGIRLYVSAGHSESDILKLAEALKRVTGLILKNSNP